MIGHFIWLHLLYTVTNDPNKAYLERYNHRFCYDATGVTWDSHHDFPRPRHCTCIQGSWPVYASRRGLFEPKWRWFKYSSSLNCFRVLFSDNIDSDESLRLLSARSATERLNRLRVSSRSDVPLPFDLVDRSNNLCIIHNTAVAHFFLLPPPTQVLWQSYTYIYNLVNTIFRHDELY